MDPDVEQLVREERLVAAAELASSRADPQTASAYPHWAWSDQSMSLTGERDIPWRAISRSELSGDALSSTAQPERNVHVQNTHARRTRW